MERRNRMKRIILAVFLVLLAALTANADDLADIKDAGVLRFGVSPENFPFAFFDKNDDLTGIDVKLMEKIAERMDVDLDVYEISSDDLIDSLQIGQVDVIGGAFSKTKERKELLDFSKIYYSAEAVFVSKDDLKMTEPLTADSFTGLKIGVQKDSGFEEWLNSELMEKGIIERKNIFRYSSVSDAMKALNKGRIDLVMMDSNVYLSSYQETPDHSDWQYGSPEDSFAFGVRKNPETEAESRTRKAADLKSEIDKYLSELLKDGTAQKIADSFFTGEYEDTQPLIRWQGKQAISGGDVIPASTAISTVSAGPLPTATAKPVSATPVPEKCTYNMTYVADVTVPDGQQFSPGTYFTKTWRIKNSGTCTWTTNFTFDFVSGSQMNGWGQHLPKTVYPGDTVDISIDMTAPYNPGSYQGNWQLKDPLGYGIGTPIWVKIIVPGSSAPTAIPYSDYDTSPVQQSVKPVLLWYYPNFYTQKSGQCVNVYWGLDKFSTMEIRVDGTEVYYGTDESGYTQICNEVYSVGQHNIELCAYAAGGTTCETLLYTTN